MFEPRIPADVVIRELRRFCDETALTLLTKHIEGEAAVPDVVLTTDQKKHFLDLWSCTVLFFGATEREGPTMQLCTASSRAATKADGNSLTHVLFVGPVVQNSKNEEDRGQVIFHQLLDHAFGAGTFDHSARTKAFPGADLGMCVRYAGHLMKMHKVKF